MIIEAARGGHTPVIRCLLDYLPPNVKAAGAKAQAGNKQGQGMGKAGAPGQAAKMGADGKGGSQPKGSTSVLRKCRSTSTLDSGPPTSVPPSKDTGDKTKAKAEQGNLPQVAKPAPSGKEGLPTSKPAPPPTGATADLKSLPIQNLSTTDGKSVMVVEGGKSVPGAKGLEVTTAGKKHITVAGMCSDCCKSVVPSTPTQHDAQQVLQSGHVHVKRPAAPAEPSVPTSSHQLPPSSITAGIVTPTSPSAFTPVSNSGPPLVASQVCKNSY